MAGITPTSSLNLEALGLKSSAPAAAQAKSQLGQGDFLKLLTTQLQNQDPLKPVENEAFVAQMAQFSSLAGISEMNQKLGEILATLGQGQLATATGLVGKYVLTPAKSGVQDGDGALFGAVEIPTGATDVTLTIKDNSGATLRTIALGSPAAGAFEYAWDGKNDAGIAVTPQQVAIEASGNVGGQREALASSVYALVEAVNLPSANRPMTLQVQGLGTVKLDQIQKVSR